MTSLTPDSKGPTRTACDGTLNDPAGYPSALYEGQIVYFCTRACRRVFRSDPARFMAGEIAHPSHEDPLDANDSGAKALD